jgi:GntR family transcriptional repressor for pyruvate dehydrogenase complex
MTLSSLAAASRTEQVVSQLTQSILSGDIAQGSLLPPERELAERLGVSRNVVREATKILKSRGLLDIRQGIGTIVKSVTSEPVQQTFNNALHGHDDALSQLTEVRLVLEVQIAALAAQRATPAQLDELSALLEAMDKSFTNHTRFADLDVEFHNVLAAATQNRIFVLMLESVSALLHQSRELTLAAFPVAEAAQKAHKAIFRAIKVKDGVAAAQAMSAHLDLQRRDFEAIKRGATQGGAAAMRLHWDA